jgi:plasmid stabilization system protein ParE
VVEIAIHPEAEAEYEVALGWYFDRSATAANRFETAVNEAIEAIQSHPNMFPLCDQTHRFVMLKRYPFSVIYRVKADSVEVIALAHSKRRLGYWSGRS